MNIDRIAEQEVADAAAAGEELTPEIARVVAGWFHGGQASALYAFASSGYFEGDALQSEIRRCNRMKLDSATKQALAMLEAFVAARISKDDSL